MPTPEKINILVATDDKYSSYCGIMLTSLLDNNKNEYISIHLMTAGLCNESISFLKDIVENRYNQNLHIYVVDEDKFKDCPIRKGDHITLAGYYRIICADIIPSDIDKILYLDCDIIVRDSIREFWDYDISEYALAATLDPAWTQGQKYERLSLNPDDKYFCSGVMLINLKYWRDIHATSQCFNVLSSMRDNLIQHDQDILNVVFSKNWLSVSYRWDYCCLDDFSFASEQEFIADFNKKSKYYPIIIHFAGLKPWAVRGYYLYQCEFDKYYQMALGKSNPAKYRSIARIKRWGKKHLGLLGWKDRYME